VNGLVFSGVPELLVTCSIVLVAQFVYVLFGFGAGLIAVGGLTLVGVGLQDVVVMLLLVNVPVELLVVTGSRRAVRWRGLTLVCAGAGVGIWIGSRLLRDAELPGLLTALGIFLVATGACFLALPRLGPVRWPKWTAPLAGAASGLLGALFGTGGPPLIVYYRLAGIAKATFRANLMTVFLTITLVRVPVYAAFGLLTVPRLYSALAIAPAVVVGSWLGQRIHLEVSEPRFRALVNVALVVIGGLILVRGLG